MSVCACACACVVSPVCLTSVHLGCSVPLAGCKGEQNYPLHERQQGLSTVWFLQHRVAGHHLMMRVNQGHQQSIRARTPRALHRAMCCLPAAPLLPSPAPSRQQLLELAPMWRIILTPGAPSSLYSGVFIRVTCFLLPHPCQGRTLVPCVSLSHSLPWSSCRAGAHRYSSHAMQTFRLNE